MDTLLLPFFHAGETESDATLTRVLTEHAEPVIRGIIKAKFHVSRAETDSRQSQDTQDIYNEVLVQVLAGLRDCKADPENKAITDFRSYVAVVTYHVCYEHLRQKYPQRRRLKNSLRYLLTNQADFALWKSEREEWLCGLAEWRGRKEERAGAGQLQQLRDDPQALEGLELGGRNIVGSNLASLLKVIFMWLEKPVELDDLVNTVADLQGIKDPTAPAETGEEVFGVGTHEQLADAHAGSVASEVEQRFYLRRLWAEICQLPLRQRTALLLNLKDARGSSSIELFLLLGIASIPQIAATVEIPLENFASLWKELPLDDTSIAALLGLTRQQVINLRKAARDRLARRMRGF
jgi:DNA-directed RNA polymerase specialized sigma24 family protein